MRPLFSWRIFPELVDRFNRIEKHSLSARDEQAHQMRGKREVTHQNGWWKFVLIPKQPDKGPYQDKDQLFRGTAGSRNELANNSSTVWLCTP